MFKKDLGQVLLVFQEFLLDFFRDFPTKHDLFSIKECKGYNRSNSLRRVKKRCLAIDLCIQPFDNSCLFCCFQLSVDVPNSYLWP